MPTGKVKWYDAAKGFGFLSQEDGEDVYVRSSALPAGVEGLKAALGRQSAVAVGLVRVGVNVTAGRFLAERLPSLLGGHPGLKVELVLSDRFGDMIEERLDLAQGDVGGC